MNQNYVKYMHANYKLRTTELIKNNCSSQIVHLDNSRLNIIIVTAKCFKKIAIRGIIDKYMY